MRTLPAVLAASLIAAVAPVAATAAGLQVGASPVECPDLTPPPLQFAEPVYVDKARAGGEPVVVTAEDGSISYSAHAGTTHAYKDPAALAGAGDFAVGYWNQTLNWRSTDGGKTWKYVGTLGQQAGPHSLTSTGFSDPGFAMDDGGRLYNVEIDLANVAVFSSNDDGQSWLTANPEITAGDRPWVLGGRKDEAYLYVRLPAQIWRTQDGGLTWLPVRTSGVPVYGQLFRDPLDAEKDGLVGPASGSSTGGFSLSPDGGATWRTVRAPGFSASGDQIFAPIDVDKADGTVYMANGNGYRAAGDRTPDGYLEFNWYDRAAGAWGLDKAQRIAVPEGDVLWTWMVAGEDGRVALTWYQTLKGKPTEFRVYVAQTLNGKGSTVTCSDGSQRFVEPQWTVADASGRPVHVGEVCLGGTGCNANTNFAAGDRRLGDFYEMDYDRAGNLIIATGDTMLRSPTGGPKPVANPLFIRQTGGARMLEQPLPVRESRCLMDLPTC